MTTRERKLVVVAFVAGVLAVLLGWRIWTVNVHGIPISPEECVVMRLRSVSPTCTPGGEDGADRARVGEMLKECLGPGVYDRWQDEVLYPWWCGSDDR